jgi:UPF0288 family protein (methanogenesis marker protein 3)
MKNEQGNLVHDTITQMTITSDLDDKIKANTRKLTTVISTMKRQAASSRSLIETLVRMENGTRQMTEQGSHFFSCMREVELVLNKLYTDLGEILFQLN